ncbi:MAG: hypothetical protein NC133_02970 [Prevotella sp.]|nr:hypothetical protein [Prevotella sp.]
MKRFLQIVCWLGAGVALGLSIGTQTKTADQNLLMVIASVVFGVLFIAAVILSAVLVRDGQQRKNLGVSYQKHDFILQAGTVYTVTKHGKLRPGQYIVLATDESNRQFNLRVNDYVKEYQHNTTLVLADGDTVSARSGNVLLR